LPTSSCWRDFLRSSHPPARPPPCHRRSPLLAQSPRFAHIRPLRNSSSGLPAAARRLSPVCGNRELSP
jgi:hypothetical protein